MNTKIKIFARGVADGFPSKELPIYMFLLVLTALMGIMMLAILDMKGATAAQAKEIAYSIKLIMYMEIGTPLVFGLTGGLYNLYKGDAE